MIHDCSMPTVRNSSEVECDGATLLSPAPNQLLHVSSATNLFGLVSRNDYLHQNGWKASDRPLHQQPFVINAMSEFHKKTECMAAETMQGV